MDGSGTRDIVEHGKQGLLVENDAGALAAAIHEVLSDPNKQKRFSNNALKKAKTFDVGQLSKQMVGVYEQAIQDKRENRYVTLNSVEAAKPEVASTASTSQA